MAEKQTAPAVEEKKPEKKTKEPTLVHTKLQRDGRLATVITKAAGGSIIRTKELCEILKQVPSLEAAATAAADALGILATFVDKE